MVGASDRSWLAALAPAEVKAPAAQSETAPLVSGGPLVPSTDVSVTIADDVPLLLIRARAILSCGNRRGTIGPSSSTTLSLSQWLRVSISMMVLFVPFLDVM